jgi:AcrR family transcriptional regulator
LSIAKLNRNRILKAAVRLADEGGIESLTMRKLARTLGVEAMSLYNHVANKGDLVDGMVDLVVGEVELPETGEWDEAVRECAISAHETFVRHPWACSLAMVPSQSRILLTPRLRYMEWLLGRLREAGFSADLTYHAYHTLDSHILGFTLWELGHAAGAKRMADGENLADIAAGLIAQLRENGFPHLAEHAEQHLAGREDGGSEFEFGLDLILEGLRRARNDASMRP